MLFIGRLVPQKGIDDLITALALLPAGERPALDIVGDGPIRESLERQAKAAGLDAVQFLGPKPAQWLVENGARYLALVAPSRPRPMAPAIPARSW